MSAAWDPATGKSVTTADLDELLAAAGVAPAVAQTTDTPRADALHIDLIVLGGAHGSSTIADSFVTSDVGIAADRMCTFLSRVVDTTSQVRISTGALSAIVCLHPSGTAFETSWMHRGLAHRAQTPPAIILYSAKQLPIWIQSVCRAFQGVIWNATALQQLEEVARNREAVTQHALAAGDAIMN